MAVANVFIQNTATIPATLVSDYLWFIEGATPVDTNLDHQALTAGGLGKVFLAHPWTADVGTASAPFIAEINFEAASILDNKAGGGTFYYHIEGTATSGADTCKLLRSHGPGNRRTVLVNGGTADAIEVSTGIVDVTEPVAVTTVRLAGSGTVNMPDTTSTDPTLVEMKGGTWNTERGATTIDQWGGLADVDAGTNAITTWNLRGGSGLIRQSGTITTLNWYGGVFDVSKLGRNLTVTNTNVYGDVDSAALRDLIHNPKITLSNPPVYRMQNA